MDYIKLIGFKLDTNQFTSKTIDNIDEAKMYINKVIGIYGKEILHYMFLTDFKMFTPYRKQGVTLYEFLTPNKINI